MEENKTIQYKRRRVAKLAKLQPNFLVPVEIPGMEEDGTIKTNVLFKKEEDIEYKEMKVGDFTLQGIAMSGIDLTTRPQMKKFFGINQLNIDNVDVQLARLQEKFDNDIYQERLEAARAEEAAKKKAEEAAKKKEESKTE